MNFRMNDIINFVATSNCSTIVQAAQKLEISQPALSESIKRLETDFKVILFYRSRTGIALTSSGKVFLMKAQNVLQSIDQLPFSNATGAIFGNRSITIGCHQTVAAYSIPKALALIKRKAADFKIELVHDISRNIQTLVQKGSIDIGIVINAVSVPDLVMTKLALDTFAVWTAPNASKADTVICDPNLFQTQSILNKWKSKPNRIISTSSLDLITRLVSENIGYGILPAKAVSLTKLPLKQVSDTPIFQDVISLVYRPEFGKVPFERLVIDSLKTLSK